MTAVTPSSPASATAGPQNAAPTGEGAAAKPQAAGAAADGPSEPPTPADAALSSAAAFVRAAAARQGGLAALYADLESIVSEPNLAAAVPAPVLAAAQQLLAMRLDVEPGAAVTANDIKAALAQSGLFGDFLAAAEPSPQQGGAANLGGALATLRQALQVWLGAATDQAPSPNATAPTAVASPTTPRGPVPMPPYRGAPTVAQAPVAASIPAGASARVLALHLIGETDAAIARQSLLQMASLSDAGGSAGADATHAARAMFDVPLATQQGTAVAQLLIEPDRQKSGQPSAARPIWRASFSVDLEPIGPVHVRIALAGERTSVTMTAERSASAAALSASLPLLEAGLREAALEPGELRSQTGAAPSQVAAPGLFVDRAT